MSDRPLLLLCWFLIALPGMAWAQEPPPDEEGVPEATAAEAQAPATSVDPLTLHMEREVARYYEGIGVEPPADALRSGLESMRFMLLDGVTLDRISAAIDRALSLHIPGRQTPFEVAVPLRVRPDSTKKDGQTVPEPGWRPSVTPAPPRTSRLSPEIEERRRKQREELAHRRNRLRLNRQWKDRTRDKRLLLSVGVPFFAAGYALGFVAAGVTKTQNGEDGAVVWLAAIPVAGSLAFGIATEGAYPFAFTFAILQGVGATLTVIGAALKVDWPYDEDPLALKFGRRPHEPGRAALTISPGPLGISGRF